MQGSNVVYSFYVPGTLSADLAIYFKAPQDLQLIHVSAVGSNANDGLLILGPSTDTDGYLASASIGDSGAPVEFERSNFVGTQYPHISEGTIIVATLDHDGAGGTATANFTLVLTFTEG